MSPCVFSVIKVPFVYKAAEVLLHLHRSLCLDLLWLLLNGSCTARRIDLRVVNFGPCNNCLNIGLQLNLHLKVRYRNFISPFNTYELFQTNN